MDMRWAGFPSCFYAMVFGAVILATGCTHLTADVEEKAAEACANGSDCKLPGIPFFHKKGVCNRESVWLEPQYTLALTIQADEGPPVTKRIEVSRAGYLSPQSQDLLQVLAGLKGTYSVSTYPASCPSAIGKKWDALEMAVAYYSMYRPQENLDIHPELLKQAQEKGNALLVANKAQPGAAPDYSRHDYLNSISPWNGSAQVDAKLAPDGTLSEGSAQRDDETLSTILSGLTGLVGDFAGVPAATTGTPADAANAELSEARVAGAEHNCPAHDSNWPSVANRVKYTVSLKTLIYTHDHKKQEDLAGQCEAGTEPVYAGNFTVALADDSSAKKSDKAIQFSGQVKLPESSTKKNDDAAKDSSD